jgi:hypothetical protein
MDRSKADPFTKVFALVQAGWLVLHSCARKIVGLPITELELMTMAFTICALVTYILWWHKPFDAERSAVVSLPKSCYNAIQVVLGSPYDTGKSLTEFRQNQHNVDVDWGFFIGIIGGINVKPSLENPDFVCSLTLYVFGAIFSAVHFAAWNWIFPLPIVQTLWRCFCCVALGSALLPAAVFSTRDSLDRYWNSRAARTLLLAFIVVNTISRLALIGLTFYCFSSMPANMYQELNWTLFLPHFS